VKNLLVKVHHRNIVLTGGKLSVHLTVKISKTQWNQWC
jgi:hypothetical protein